MMVRGFSGIKTHFGFILREVVEGLIMWPMIPMLANEARLMIDTDTVLVWFSVSHNTLVDNSSSPTCGRQTGFM